MRINDFDGLMGLEDNELAGLADEMYHIEMDGYDDEEDDDDALYGYVDDDDEDDDDDGLGRRKKRRKRKKSKRRKKSRRTRRKKPRSRKARIKASRKPKRKSKRKAKREAKRKAKVARKIRRSAAKRQRKKARKIRRTKKKAAKMDRKNARRVAKYGTSDRKKIKAIKKIRRKRFFKKVVKSPVFKVAVAAAATAAGVGLVRAGLKNNDVKKFAKKMSAQAKKAMAKNPPVTAVEKKLLSPNPYSTFKKPSLNVRRLAMTRINSRTPPHFKKLVKEAKAAVSAYKNAKKSSPNPYASSNPYASNAPRKVAARGGTRSSKPTSLVPSSGGRRGFKFNPIKLIEKIAAKEIKPDNVKKGALNVLGSAFPKTSAAVASAQEKHR